MVDNNTKTINEIMSRALVYSAFAIILLLISVPFGIFQFSPVIINIIIFAGIPATLLPRLLYILNVPDTFLKYYMLIALGLTIGLLGTQSGIGIYITYILVPVASCLYINKRFTLIIGTVCYIVMVIGVYFNTARKLEVIYKGWSHALAFRSYIIGFTIEYVLVMLFLYYLVSRAQHFLKMHQDNLLLQKKENERQKKIASFYINALSGQRTTVFNAISSEMDKFTTEDFVKMASGHRFTATIQDMLRSASDESLVMHNSFVNIGEYFGLVRIFYIEAVDGGHDNNKLTYSWAKSEKYGLHNFYSHFDEEDYALISAEYDKNGYIQLIPKDEDLNIVSKNIECGLTRYIESIALGAQLWIPTLSSGNYNGAICFEKITNEPFSFVDILVLSDIVTTLSMYVNSTNADRANQAKSAFLSTMSHEIRTPMNAILGMTTVALREDMNDTVRNSLNIIKSSSEGLLAIINDILDFSKIESGRFEIVPEDYQIDVLMNDIKVIAETRNMDKNLDLIFDIDDDMPKVLHGDVVRIKQVMVNLVTNAIKYTDTGSVTISLSCSECSATSVIMKYSVKDTGQGIREEDRDKLFTSFSQFNQKINHHQEGTGLGLAISKQLVTLMNGYLGFESKFGVGSTFYFEIPQTIVLNDSLDKELDNKTDSAKSKAFTAPDANILIVDDNDINRMVAEAMLDIFEMNIDLADGGIQALEKTSSKKYDIIFMDHFMPDLDGIETTKRIRSDEQNPNNNTTIIALTADVSSEAKEMMFEVGMNDFLSKPLDMKHCTEILMKYL